MPKNSERSWPVKYMHQKNLLKHNFDGKSVGGSSKFRVAKLHYGDYFTSGYYGVKDPLNNQKSQSIPDINELKSYFWKFAGRSQGVSRVMTPSEVSKLSKKCLPWAF